MDSTVQGAVIRMQLVGANPKPHVTGLDELPGKSNYFIGSDPEKWRTNVPHYAQVQYREVYPGVDMVYYGNQGKLEYDLVVAPGADPDQVQLAWEGLESLELNPEAAFSTPPLTLELIPEAVLLLPPLTLDWSPEAVLPAPPPTLDAFPEAVWLPPPLTLDASPEAVLFRPPLTLAFSARTLFAIPATKPPKLL